MKANISNTLRRILEDTQRETEKSRKRTSFKRIKQMIKDAPPLLSFSDSLSSGYCLIAEIKEQSPSQGKMLRENVNAAPEAYRSSPFVKAISVLTNKTHFGAGMTVERMRKIKEYCKKPVLRKDFITESYQIHEARAFGADAILLMANILDRNELRDLSDVASDLGMDVLFETHCANELKELPEGAGVIGINSRNFNSGFRFARLWKWLGKGDSSTRTSRMDYANQIDDSAIKIAESGVTHDNCADVFSKGFNAALIGTSLLLDNRGVDHALSQFEEILTDLKVQERSHSLVPVIS